MSAGTAAKRSAASDGISDDAVAAATGKRWPQWHALLDRAGAAGMTHKEIAHWLAAEHQLSRWWSQMVTVAYERARGRRQVHEKSDGFSASVSRTLPVAARALYDAWADASRRRHWLGAAPLEARTARAHRSLRFGWDGGASVVAVSFAEKGEAKCQVVVQHDRLADVVEVTRMKTYWSAALDRLRAAVLASVGGAD